MKAIIITQPGGPEVLQPTERPQPTPAAGEVLIKVHAAGVNRPDISQRKGHYPPPVWTVQDIPGLEVAGEVVALGDHVSRWHIGDKVCALVTGGGYAEYCTAPEGQCLPLPDGLNMIEAASLPETFFTVWSNVFDRAHLQPSETLLIHGGSSGIGVAAIQMATALGSKVYATAGSDDKCRFCVQLGAGAAINYKTQNFKQEIARLTNGQGVDVILDMVGGDYTPDNLASLAPEGRLVMINTMKGSKVNVDLSPVMQKRLTITGSTLRPRDTAFKSAVARKLETHIWPLIASRQIKPIIYKTFPAEKAGMAHTLMESSEHIGKIILTFH
ncbi:NADPH2:quinone reductase [Mucilaginibacter yixingensis]|uniref:NADPH2:quinone reductase n=1 Tax=Mucilaginibacter yixingensis TaxID=1295612 RepID=A0A2T5JB16_9SPHI|nr:NAD(P)H-quinone oxidoreductase [Mucilaginibacter yixingensis]PTQ98055.1 NADPH2:quinone reductase [Mucilaginibacter yixingensis]